VPGNGNAGRISTQLLLGFCLPDDSPVEIFRQTAAPRHHARVRRQQSKLTMLFPIQHSRDEPVQISALSGIARTLYDMAISAQQEPLAHRITYLFGNAECPHCEAVFSIPEGIMGEKEMA